MSASLVSCLSRLALAGRSQASHTATSAAAASCSFASSSRCTIALPRSSAVPSARPRAYATDAASTSVSWSQTPKPFSIGHLSPAIPKKTAKRLGRGPSSGRGGTSTRGHKGQKARRGNGKPTPGFEGGQTPLMIRYPKRGFVNAFAHETVPLNISRLQEWISAGRLDASKPITVKELFESRCIHRVGDGGVKLLGEGAMNLLQPVNVVVSRASVSAIAAIEAAGGSITCVYYTPLTLRALLKPEKWTSRGKMVPRQSMPIGRKDLLYYSDIRNRGYLAKLHLNKELDPTISASSQPSSSAEAAQKIVEELAPKEAAATLV
ncbi:unnamed protein product [Parajaminaea phylloscopi]